MVIPIGTVLKPVYKKVGAVGVQGVVALYLLYRYTRGFIDPDFAKRLCSEDLQAAWVVDIPFVWVTALTPVIVWLLAEWSRRDARADGQVSRRIAVHVVSAAIPPMAALLVARSHGESSICATDIWSPLWRPGTWLIIYGSLCILSSVRVLWAALATLRPAAPRGPAGTATPAP
jgi:hypothetical protein